MTFTSLSYLIFLTVVALLCYILKPKLRNILLLAASYLFYGLFGVQYMPILLLTTVVGYAGGIIMQCCPAQGRKPWLVAALLLDFGLLFVFKYFNFFSSTLTDLLSAAGIPAVERGLKLLLPVGISFYLFQTTGYLIDVYRGTIAAERNFIDFALFSSFFPGLVSGPIQRAGKMLPQYKAKSVFSYENIKSGSLQFIWGAFKKLVIADCLAVIVNTAYSDPAKFSGFQLAFAAVCYSVQIYCDFSAYSDMAIGSARVMGIGLPKNFDCPYFAVSLRDFWKRWHISLTSWFRDYLYIPLGGNRRGKWRGYLNIVIVFLVSGLWHGAAWGFIIWGGLHGVLQVAGKILEPYRNAFRRRLHIADSSRGLKLFRHVFIFLLITLLWIFFRADSVEDAVLIILRIFTSPLPIGGISVLGLSRLRLLALLIAVVVLFVSDWAQQRGRLSQRLCQSVFPRYAVFAALLMVILVFGSYGPGFDPMDFVYFKF